MTKQTTKGNKGTPNHKKLEMFLEEWFRIYPIVYGPQLINYRNWLMMRNDKTELARVFDL